MRVRFTVTVDVPGARDLDDARELLRVALSEVLAQTDDCDADVRAVVNAFVLGAGGLQEIPDAR